MNKEMYDIVKNRPGFIAALDQSGGSTGKACMFENRERNANYHFIGIEMTDEYLPIAKTRIDYAKYKYQYDEIKEKEERKAKGIVNLFDLLEEGGN